MICTRDDAIDSIYPASPYYGYPKIFLVADAASIGCESSAHKLQGTIATSKACIYVGGISL